MSEYVNNYNFNAFMAPNDETFDLSFFDNEPPIGQNGPAAYDHDAGYDLNLDIGAGMNPGFGFDAPMALNEVIFDPSLFDNTALVGQNEPAIHQYNATPALPNATAFISPLCKGNITCIHLSSNQSYEAESEPRGHGLLSCKYSYCSGLFFSQEDLRSHQRVPHTLSHHPVWNDTAIACAECKEIFGNLAELWAHVEDKKHSPYACSCGSNFARDDALTRHIASHLKENAKHPCTFCRRHRGKQAFRRKDHLVQHLQGYHKMEQEEIGEVVPKRYSRDPNQGQDAFTCAHIGCEAYRDDAFRSLPIAEKRERGPFKKQSDYSKHMRDVHKESTFPCRVAGCDRVGAKGYMREKDLIKHIKNKHPGAPQHVPS